MFFHLHFLSFSLSCSFTFFSFVHFFSFVLLFGFFIYVYCFYVFHFFQCICVFFLQFSFHLKVFPILLQPFVSFDVLLIPVLLRALLFLY